MPEVQAPPPLPKSQPSFGRRHSTIIKLLGVGALVLVLLIPLAMITGVLRERLQRRNEAVADITSSWGKEQNLIGPVLGIPYQYKFKAVKEVPTPDGRVERREVEETGTANAYFLPGSQVPGYTTGATASLGGDQPISTEIPFSIPLDFNGSEGVFFAPFGVQNEATLKSNSPDVGFRGAFLPAERSLRPDGFDAKWRISYYGRDYPQSWTSRTGNERFTTTAVSNSLFGAQFLSILDAYRYVERSIKYGVLFLVLVFTAFFLFEVTARQKLHPFQYLMVGAALCLFYLLLLSISEFIGFSWAYLIAAVASTVLITWYCNFFLGGGVRTLMIGAGLGGVYLFLYITLRQQDYALLMGAIALFIVLAIVMYVTRKIDWYARDAS